MSASWIVNKERENERVNEQEWENIIAPELKAALTKSQKWISPGIDKVPNSWLNAHFVPCYIYKMQNLEKTLEWMFEGRKYLLGKNNDTKSPKNYRLITCLSTT